MHGGEANGRAERKRGVYMIQKSVGARKVGDDCSFGERAPNVRLPNREATGATNSGGSS